MKADARIEEAVVSLPAKSNKVYYYNHSIIITIIINDNNIHLLTINSKSCHIYFPLFLNKIISDVRDLVVKIKMDKTCGLGNEISKCSNSSSNCVIC